MKDPIALCVTCIVDQVMPEVGVATVKLLRRAGFTVEFPEAQTCCGQPFFNSGFQPEAAKLARRIIEIFEPYPAVVLPSGSCTTMIRHEYPSLLAAEPEWYGRAQALAAKTFELSEFLAREAPEWLEKLQHEGRDGEETAVTYHDSCHMCRLLGIEDQPRQLLQASGHAVAEMEENRCCGFGGLFSVRMPEVSNAMTHEKLELAAATGTHVMVTADPGCLMQIRGLNPESMRIEHLATVLEEATR